MCALLHKLAVVTIGQSPRPDIWDEIAARLCFPFQAAHYGLLDDKQALAALRVASPDSFSLVTRLRDGKAIWISSQGVREYLPRLISRIKRHEKFDAIVFLCTGIGGIDCGDFPPVLYPGRMISNALLKRSASPVGVVLPDKRQVLHLEIDFPGPELLPAEVKPPGIPQLFQSAALMLQKRGAACVAFHCMGFPLSALDFFTPFFQDAVFHPRQLIIDELNKRMYGKV